MIDNKYKYLKKQFVLLVEIQSILTQMMRKSTVNNDEYHRYINACENIQHEIDIITCDLDNLQDKYIKQMQDKYN